MRKTPKRGVNWVFQKTFSMQQIQAQYTLGFYSGSTLPCLHHSPQSPNRVKVPLA